MFFISKKKTPLLTAILDGKVKIAYLLIKNTPDLNATDKNDVSN